MTQLIDLTGKHFGRLIVIQRMDNNKWGQSKWLCRCNCGKEKIILGQSLKNGDTKSCGCLHTKHNHSRQGGSRIYNIWESMIQRCTNPNNISYPDYGDRGIKICKRWRSSFKNFLEDMGKVPEGHQIDRIDNNKGYCKVNCRWVTPKQNSRNRRDNRLETYDGKTQCLSAWAEEYKINYKTLHTRLSRGWSIKRALITPARKY